MSSQLNGLSPRTSASATVFASSASKTELPSGQSEPGGRKLRSDSASSHSSSLSTRSADSDSHSDGDDDDAMSTTSTSTGNQSKAVLFHPNTIWQYKQKLCARRGESERKPAKSIEKSAVRDIFSPSLIRKRHALLNGGLRGPLGDGTQTPARSAAQAAARSYEGFSQPTKLNSNLLDRLLVSLDNKNAAVAISPLVNGKHFR